MLYNLILYIKCIHKTSLFIDFIKEYNMSHIQTNKEYEDLYASVCNSSRKCITTSTIRWDDVDKLLVYLREKYDVKLHCWAKNVELGQTPYNITFSLYAT